VGDAGDAVGMKLAAVSLVISNSAIKDLVPLIRAAKDKAATDDARLNLALLLANAYLKTENGPELRSVAAEILKQYPDSYTAIGLAGSADGMLKDWSHWSEMLESRLAKHPDDETLLRLKSEYSQAKGDFDLGRATEQSIIDKGKAVANDYNMYAWMSLFDGKVDSDVVKSAQQAVMLTRQSGFAELHTLACIYAYQGKSAEARDLLLKAMAIANLSEPNEPIWYGFGNIYEQYGINDSAIEAYKKVEKPEGRIGPTSTYLLAQARLRALGE